MDDNLTIKKIKNSWIKCKHRYFIHLKSTCQIKTFKSSSYRQESKLNCQSERKYDGIIGLLYLTEYLKRNENYGIVGETNTNHLKFEVKYKYCC